MHGDRQLVVGAAPRIIGGGVHDAFTSPFVVRLYDAGSAPRSIGFCGGARSTSTVSLPVVCQLHVSQDELQKVARLFELV